MMKRLIIFTILCLPHLSKADENEPRCIWYEVCQVDEKRYNCAYDGPPKLLTDPTAQRILKMRCPHLYQNSSVPTCCSAQQVIDMHEGFEKGEGIFGRCTTCKRNMLLSICALNCAPDHSRFLVPKIENNIMSRPYITEVKFKIDKKYSKETYDSCAGIVHPPTGRPAMDLACGLYNSRTCNPERWYEFMGDPIINSMVPFKIEYVYDEDDDEKRFSATPLPCNEAYEDMYPCSCIDCAKSCPSGNPPAGEDLGFVIGAVNGVTLIVAVVVGSLGTVCVIVSSIICRRSIFSTMPQWFSGFEIVHRILTDIFRWWGTFCAKNPVLILAICSWIVGGLAYGIQFMKITTNPVDIWAAKTSQARLEKDYFDNHFGPFYRTNQIFIKPINPKHVEHNTSAGSVKFGPAFDKMFLLEVFKLQESIENIGLKDGKGLDKICYAPMTYVGANAELRQCAVQSLYGYFGNRLENFNLEKEENGYLINYLNVIDNCLASPMSIDCLAPYGGPVEPGIAVGGMPKPEPGEAPDYRLATGVVLTFLVRNHVDSKLLQPALEWEMKFVKFLKNYKSDDIDIAFSAERSVQDAIEELSEGETFTVVISYAVMFLYIAIALGRISGIRSFLKESRITLAIGGIFIVSVSVICSLGFFGYIGVATTMLSIEVIPFLVLAVGVDNIFILVHAYNRLNPAKYKTVEEAVGEAVGQMGPSILQTSASEFACFAIGTLSDMPAVKTFAMYAAGAIYLDFMFQITAFVALMSIDQRRYAQGRLDLLCCVRIKNTTGDSEPKAGPLHRLVEKYYAPFLLSRIVKPIVLIIFIIWTSLSVIIIPSIEPGLDQQLSMPVDSHVYKYFQYMADLLSMGAPIYWVLGAGLDFANPTQQNLICGGQNCNKDSLSTQLYIATNYPNVTHLFRPAASWIDDYIDWLGIEACCRVNKTDGSFCPSNHPSSQTDCVRCSVDFIMGRPTDETFRNYLTFFLSDLPNVWCAKGGRASYSDGVNYILDEHGNIHVKETHFMQYSTTSVTSKEFYSTLREARKVSDNIQEMFKKNNVNLKLFPYCIFFVYYEQYLTIWRDSLISLGISLLAIFLVTFLVTGFDIISALLVFFMVLLILVNIAGLMWLWNITLNAVSLVNLVVSVGIGVEFVSHIIRSYKGMIGTMPERANKALSLTGSSVLSGITLTKFAGIIVLAFSKSQIFQVFYFRMYLLIVLVGAAHGLILLPVILSFFGPPSKGKVTSNGLSNGFSR